MYTSEDIEKYIKKGVQHLYIDKANYETFTNYCADSMTRLLMAMSEKSHGDSNDEVNKSVHMFVQNHLKEAGLDKVVTDVVKKSVETTMKVAEKIPSIGKLLANMKNNNDYLYQHSILISYLVGPILDKMDWKSNETKHKITLSAILHDVILEDPEIAKISTLDSPAAKKLSSSELEAYKQHPKQVSEMVAASNDFPPDIDRIIYEHHERPDSSGFPRGIGSTTIFPVAAILIIAHQIVDILYQENFSDDANEKAITYLKENFLKGSFRKPVQAAIEVLQGA